MLLRLFSYFKKVKWLLCRNVWIKHKQVYVQREFLWGRLMCKFSPRLSLRNLPRATVNSSIPTPQVYKRHLMYLFCCLCACHCPLTEQVLWHTAEANIRKLRAHCSEDGNILKTCTTAKVLKALSTASAQHGSSQKWTLSGFARTHRAETANVPFPGRC